MRQRRRFKQSQSLEESGHDDGTAESFGGARHAFGAAWSAYFPPPGATRRKLPSTCNQSVFSAFWGTMEASTGGVQSCWMALNSLLSDFCCRRSNPHRGNLHRWIAQQPGQ
jgi:hypothetical protein